MTFAEKAFEACAALAKAKGRRLTKPEWLEAVQAAYDAESPKKPRKQPSTASEIDEAWLEELEAMPAYAGIDIKRELGKAQAWAGVNKVAISRRRFINWLNKAQPDRIVAFSGTGQTSFKPKPVADPEPAGWREWVRENSQDPSNADKPWSGLDATAKTYIRSQLAHARSFSS